MAKKQAVKEKNILMIVHKILEKWKVYTMSGRKKKGIISLSLDKDCTFENLSEHFQFTFKFSCFGELLLCNGTSPLVIKIFSVIFHFQVCFAWFHPIAHSYRTFSYLHSHLELVKHFYHFYIDFYIIFLEFMLLFFWLKIIQLVLFFPCEETRLKAD